MPLPRLLLPPACESAWLRITWQLPEAETKEGGKKRFIPSSTAILYFIVTRVFIPSFYSRSVSTFPLKFLSFFFCPVFFFLFLFLLLFYFYLFVFMDLILFLMTSFFFLACDGLLNWEQKVLLGLEVARNLKKKKKRRKKIDLPVQQQCKCILHYLRIYTHATGFVLTKKRCKLCIFLKKAKRCEVGMLLN